jgi:hypothetical protein
MSQDEKPEAQPEGEAEGDFGSAFAERASGDADKSDSGQPSSDAEPQGSDAQAPSQEASPAETPADAPSVPREEMTPEQIRQENERLQALLRTERGRTGALSKRLREQAAAPAPKPKSEEQPSDADGEQASDAGDLEARLDKVVEEYGDITGPLAEAIKSIRSDIAAIKPKVDEVDLDKSAYELEKAYATLEERHSDWASVAGTDEFKVWTEAQPENMKAMINSFDPAEVSLALTLYKAESGITAQATGGGDQGANGSTATGDRRQRQLEGSKQVTHRGAPAAAGVPNEFGAAFHARAKAQA